MASRDSLDEASDIEEFAAPADIGAQDTHRKDSLTSKGDAVKHPPIAYSETSSSPTGQHVETKDVVRLRQEVVDLERRLKSRYDSEKREL